MLDLHKECELEIEDGFDLSYVDTDDDDCEFLRIKCSQCEALVINGVPCHEHGCPNKPRFVEDDDDDSEAED